MKKLFSDFKKFISRGNVMDMAVGVIIGGAFGKIVTSVVNDIIMPLVTWALGANSLSDLSIVLRKTLTTDAAGNVSEVLLTWNYGSFLQTIIDFLIIAFCIFMFIKLITKSQEIIKEASALAKFTKVQKQELKQNGINPRNIEQAREYFNKKAAKEPVKATPNPVTSEDLLKDIKSLLEIQVANSNKNDNK